MKKKFIFALAVIAVSGLLLITSLMLSPEQQPLVSEPAIERVKEQYESELMAIDGVVGVGISECEGKPCLEVYLENESPNLRRQIPTQLDGFKVDTEVTGPIQALPQQQIHNSGSKMNF